MRVIRLPNSIALAVVEAGGRLVEQQQPRLRRERARDLDALERAVGQVAGARVLERVEIERAQDRAAPLGHLAAPAASAARAATTVRKKRPPCE